MSRIKIKHNNLKKTARYKEILLDLYNILEEEWAYQYEHMSMLLCIEQNKVKDLRITLQVLREDHQELVDSFSYIEAERDLLKKIMEEQGCPGLK